MPRGEGDSPGGIAGREPRQGLGLDRSELAAGDHHPGHVVARLPRTVNAVPLGHRDFLSLHGSIPRDFVEIQHQPGGLDGLLVAASLPGKIALHGAALVELQSRPAQWPKTTILPPGAKLMVGSGKRACSDRDRLARRSTVGRRAAHPFAGRVLRCPLLCPNFFSPPAKPPGQAGVYIVESGPGRLILPARRRIRVRHRDPARTRLCGRGLSLVCPLRAGGRSGVCCSSVWSKGDVR